MISRAISTIDECSRALLMKVRKALSPLPEDEVILASPFNNEMEFAVGVCLYDVQDYSPMQSSKPVYTPVDDEMFKRTLPPKLIELQYLLYANASKRFGGWQAENEHKILTRLIDSVYSDPFLSKEDGGAEMPLYFSFLPLEDKISIWHGFTKPLQNALYLNAGPLPVDGSLCEIVYALKETQLNTNPDK